MLPGRTCLGNRNVLPCVDTVATSHMWLLSSCGVASTTEGLHFKFYFILINLKHPMWLVVELDSSALDTAFYAAPFP